MMKQKSLLFVLPLIVLALASAVWSGWLRMGFGLPVVQAAPHHGGFMVNSFLAALIFLERAAGFRQKWVLCLPFVQAVSVVFFLTGNLSVAFACLLVGSLGFVGLCGYFLFRYKEFYYVVFLAGALFLLHGNAVLAYRANYPVAVNSWMGFLLLTIVAERLELSRFLGLSSTKRALLMACLALIVGGLLVGWLTGNSVLLAVSFLLTAVWLLRYDMARRNLKIKGQHRYSGLLLLVGYGWLFATALFQFFAARVPFAYDAILHSFFIGFVFSMIFSHAPIIFPAVARLPVKIYRPVLYVWFAVLQVSLVMRLAGDAAGNVPLRKTGGVLNGIAILVFFATVAVTVWQEAQKRKKTIAATSKRALLKST